MAAKLVPSRRQAAAKRAVKASLRCSMLSHDLPGRAFPARTAGDR